ncbi:MAG: TolC family protein [Bacteroidetes bacterium]|nr:TolC family protein [Bacteroidota bacterium]
MSESDARRASSIDFSDDQSIVSPRLLSRDFFDSFFYPEKNEQRLQFAQTLLWVVLVAFFLPLPTHAQDTLPFEDLMEDAEPGVLAPLEQYLEIATERNPGLQATYQEYRAQQQVGAQVGTLPDPELSLSFFANPPDQAGSIPGRLSGSVMQRVPWFGTLSTRRSEQDHRAEAQRLELEQDWLDLMAEVHQRYFAYFRVRQSIRFIQRHVELLDDLEPIIRTRYETARAAGGQVDLLRIEMEQEEIRTDIADLRHMARHLQAEFNELLNRDARAAIELPERLPMADLHLVRMHDPSSTDDLIEIARQANPGLAAYDKRQAAERDAIRLSDLEGRPSFGVGVQVMGRDHTFMRMTGDMSESVTVLASLQLPLFRGKYRAQRQEAEARLEASRLRKQQQTNELAATLESLLHTYHDATRRIDLNRNRLLPRADQAVQVLREAYSAGRTPFDEVIRMQRQILDYGVALIEAQTRQHQARAQIDALLAQPPAGHELQFTY